MSDNVYCSTINCPTGYTTEALAELQAAIASGASKIQYRDKTIEYRSLKDMLATVDLMKRALGLLTDPHTRIYPTMSKGLRPRRDGGGSCNE